MAKKWEGKSKGTVLGYKIFVFFIKFLGLSSAYFILNFVVVYYFFFSKQGRESSFEYFNNRLKYSKFKSLISVLKNTYVFGQTIIDKIAISSGLRNKFSYEFDGEHNITNLIKKKQGGILISAHVGNFEIAEFFFDEIDHSSQIHLVTTDSEHEQIKSYLESVTGKSNIKFILVNEDLNHIFEIKAALDKGGLVCFTGDRYFEGNKTLTQSLLGEEAEFPAGPFLMASRLNVPVLFVYVMKETKKHYHLYARRAKANSRDAQGLLKEYTESVEWMLRKYPLQWFNYFKFWNTKEIE
ncbi:lipid A biosynthesis acyltransferase [uncultured Maribacter sp.]|uniref:LpxL/LpxP family acyltransferase n=1 Tax=uncultured Maribacter sp. TaxID=431308 RepID=UPI002616A2CE|nr:lipid A biosynthesis acyltransferase [uncultured Maribacter sp.]